MIYTCVIIYIILQCLLLSYQKEAIIITFSKFPRLNTTVFSAIQALNKLFNNSLPNSKPSVEGTWINDTFICYKRKRIKFISLPSMNLTTPPFVSAWLKYFVVKSHITSPTIAFVGHSLRLKLIFRENKGFFLVKFPWVEITQLSNRVISLNICFCTCPNLTALFPALF